MEELWQDNDGRGLHEEGLVVDIAGFEGPLHECSIYGNRQAGEKFWAMLKAGASQPWQLTLAQMTGEDRMDASAILDYFAPLQAWLKEQNSGRQCGW